MWGKALGLGCLLPLAGPAGRSHCTHPTCIERMIINPFGTQRMNIHPFDGQEGAKPSELPCESVHQRLPLPDEIPCPCRVMSEN